jgi:hypothetical protein
LQLVFSSSFAVCRPYIGASAQTVLPSMSEEGDLYFTAPLQGNFPETTIWPYDFSSGIPSTWVNTGFNNYSSPGIGTNWSSLLEYRGPNTSPSGQLMLTTYTPLPGAALSVFDLLGRRIRHEVMSSDRLEVDGIPAGVYAVQAEQGGSV